MEADNFRDEEIAFTVAGLTAQTDKCVVRWKCEEYLPASFLLGDKLDGVEDSISHMGTFIYEASGRRFELEIHESINIDEDCCGSVGSKLSIYGGDGSLLSMTEAYVGEEDPEDKYGFVPLCNAVFKRSGEWLEDDFFERYGAELPFYPEKGATKKHREQPLCRLMERLMNGRRVEDFHRMVLDRPFREQLLNAL